MFGANGECQRGPGYAIASYKEHEKEPTTNKLTRYRDDED
jgi:hypothetical protein